MTSLKTKNIWLLAAFLFLSIVPTLAEVVNEVSDCNQFLLQRTPPNIPGILVNGNIQDQNRYKVICQTYQNKRRFLTLYDINNKIPVFSAYEYRVTGIKGRPEVTWMIEPQLEDGADQNDINMRAKGRSKTDNQAGNADYDGNKRNLDKGHLFPSNHAFGQDDKKSTFTLTNAVPQVGKFNRVRWRNMEQEMKCIMDKHINTKTTRCFVVVGARPGNNNNPLNNRVNIPSMMWSAFYCTDQTSGAYWDKNVESINKKLDMKSLKELNDELGKDWVVFPKYPPGAKVDQAVSEADCKNLDPEEEEEEEEQGPSASKRTKFGPNQ